MLIEVKNSSYQLS